MVVTHVRTQREYEFKCGEWLSRDEGDRSTSRDLFTQQAAVTYKVQRLA